MSEIYISVDIEADGPIPGDFSMLSLGAAAFYAKGDHKPLDTFEVNMYRLPGAKEDPSTMKWWKTQPEAWKHVNQSQVAPKVAMHRFDDWIKGLCSKIGMGMKKPKPVMVVYPTWDYMWVHWYFHHFLNYSPFGLGALDLKSLAYGDLNLPFRKVVKGNMPKTWFKGCPKHTHKAKEDAIGQGVLFINMRAV